MEPIIIINGPTLLLPTYLICPLEAPSGPLNNNEWIYLCRLAENLICQLLPDHWRLPLDPLNHQRLTMVPRLPVAP